MAGTSRAMRGKLCIGIHRDVEVRAAVQNAQRGAFNVVLLTSLGGGAFGNNERWIVAALRRALEMMRDIDLDTKLVSYGAPSRALVQMAGEFG
jgi:hypothetical protein